jgi:hypothetical protein
VIRPIGVQLNYVNYMAISFAEKLINLYVNLKKMALTQITQYVHILIKSSVHVYINKSGVQFVHPSVRPPAIADG